MAVLAAVRVAMQRRGDREEEEKIQADEQTEMLEHVISFISFHETAVNTA
jgi:hypothetical protein